MSEHQETIEEQFSKAEEEYVDEESVEIIKGKKAAYSESKKISMLMENHGREVINWLDRELTSTIIKLIETREARYLSDLRSLFDLKAKLTNASSVKSSVESWLKTLN